jgi:CubicO group peptidase (beta-lactamase class C family)
MRSLKVAAALAVFALGACATQPLPKPDAAGAYYFWSQPEQVLGYRNIEKIFPTRIVRRGAKTSPLQAGPPLQPRVGDGETLDSLMQRASVAGLLVLHHDRIVLERYARGYGRGQRWTSFSVGKSLSSTLLGAAIRDGAIGSVDDQVTGYLPGLKGSAYEGVTIRNVLNMTSGVKWNEDYEDANSDVARIRSARAAPGEDPIVAYMARLPRETAPGAKFVYKTGETHLIGSIVRAATHKPLADYLSEKIWGPVGMEEDAVWILDSAGNEFAGCCISATLRDFGRFGVFFKNGAKVGGRPIVPDTWVKDATTPSSAARNYGYQWWLTNGPAFNAIGIFGQQIHINPAKDLVVVVQSATVKASGDRPASAARAAIITAVTDSLPD